MLAKKTRPAPITAMTPLTGGAIWEAVRGVIDLSAVPTDQLLGEILPMAERHAPERIRAVREELARRETIQAEGDAS